MRIAKPTVWCVAIAFLALGSARAQEEELNLDDLLGDLEGSAAEMSDDASDATDEPDAMFNDLLNGLAEDEGMPLEGAGDAVEEGMDEPLDTVDDLLRQLNGDGGADASGVDDVDVDLTDLLDEGEDPDVAGDMMGGAVEDLPEVMEESGMAEVEVEVESDEASTDLDTGIPPGEDGMDSADEPRPSQGELEAMAREISAAEAARLNARKLEGLDRVQDGFDALSDRDYETAVRLLEEAIRLIPATESTQATLESARWGLSDAQERLSDELKAEGLFDDAKAALQSSLAYNPDNRGAQRKLRSLENLSPTGEPPVAMRPEVRTRNQRIAELIAEGRDLFNNGFYDEAEEVFTQIRYLDDYNIDALRFLKRINDRRLEVKDIEREMTLSELVQEVRGKWSRPLRRDIEPPDLGDDKPPDIGTGDVEEDRLLEKMRQLEIPSIEFRNANIIDVIEELRLESERADPENVGINIVLKLTGGAPAQDAALGLDTTGFDDFGTGGFDDFGTGGQMDTLNFPDPTGRFPQQAQDPFGTGQFGTGTALGTGTQAEAAATAVIPRITLTLRKISLYDALRIITQYADLKFTIDNRIVFITPLSQVTQPLETRVYAVQPSLVENVVTRTETTDTSQRQSGGSGEFIELGTQIEVSRVNVRQFFMEAGVPFPPGSSITYNAATSQLVVRNTSDNLEIFERILPNFNTPPTQVEIEARFVEILQEDLESLGVEWILTDDWEIARNTETSILGGAERLQINQNEGGFTSGLRYFSSGATGVEAAGRSGLDDIGFFGDILSFSSVLTNPEMTVILHALRQRGGTDLLSAPRITTRSGNTASIEVVREIIYPTEFEAESATSRIDIDADQADLNIPGGVVIFPEQFDTREVGVILNVTPTVGPDKYTIDLTIAPEVAELVEWIQYGTPPFNIPQPIFASRNAQTSILIWDGQTVVMGGLINEELTRYEDKVPFLGDLPFIGRLFRSEGEKSTKRNLLIFVTARIVDPAGQAINKERAMPTAVLQIDDGLSMGMGMP